MSEIERNLLLLTTYLLCIAYVFYQMYDVLSQLISIGLDRDNLEAQLELQDLKDILEINFNFRDVYRSDEFALILLKIRNLSQGCSIYIDWDQNVLTDFQSRSRRVIRIPPGLNLDLSQTQVFSLIAPGQILSETLTTETTLQRNLDNTLEINKPLFPQKSLKEAAFQNKPFTLRLILQISEPAKGIKSGQIHAIDCHLVVKKAAWRQALTWKPNPVNRKSLN